MGSTGIAIADGDSIPDGDDEPDQDRIDWICDENGENCVPPGDGDGYVTIHKMNDGI